MGVRSTHVILLVLFRREKRVDLLPCHRTNGLWPAVKENLQQYLMLLVLNLR